VTNRSPSVDLTRLRRPDVDVTRGLSGGGGMPRALEVASPRAKSRNRLVAGALVRWRARGRGVWRDGNAVSTLAAPKKHLEALLCRAPATFASSPESCDSLQTTARGQGLPPRFRGDCMPPPSDLKRTTWCP
jgi:hypothetical protein